MNVFTRLSAEHPFLSKFEGSFINYSLKVCLRFSEKLTLRNLEVHQSTDLKTQICSLTIMPESSLLLGSHMRGSYLIGQLSSVMTSRYSSGHTVKSILSTLTLCNERRWADMNLCKVVFHSKIMECVSSHIPFTHSLMCSFIYGSSEATTGGFTSAFLERSPVTSTYF